MKDEWGSKTLAITGSGSTDVCSSPTITARLKGQKHELENKLAKINEALSLMEANPEMQKIFDAISRAGY